MINNESVKSKNIRDILFGSSEEYELKKGMAVSELVSGLTIPLDKIEIESLELEAPFFKVFRSLIVLVYKNRVDCCIGGMARQTEGETDYIICRMTADLKVIRQKYMQFVIQAKSDTHLYWVRVE